MLISGERPRQITGLAGKVARYGIRQNGVGGAAIEPAGLPERKHPLHPGVPFVTVGALASLAPQHPQAKSPLCPVVNRLHPRLIEKDYQRVHLSKKPAGKATRLILSMDVLGNQVSESGILGPVASNGGRSHGHLAKPLELRLLLPANIRYGLLLALGQPPGLAHEMDQMEGE